MATYGGTDTSGLANVDYQGRSAKLKAQMDLAQQANQGLQGAGQQIQGGLTQAQGAIMQQDERAKDRELEAARSGLEYDTGSKKYIETAPAKQQREFAQGKATAEYNLEKDKATADVLQRQQQLNQQGESLRQEREQRGQHMTVEMAHAKNEAMREERLSSELAFKTGVERQELQLKLDDSTDKKLEEISSNMLKLELGDANSQKDAMTLLGPIAASDPQMAKVLDDMKSGKSSPEGIARLRSAFQEMRNQVALNGAAKTGYMSGLVDPSSPTMQQFYQYRTLYTQRMEADLNSEFQALQGLPPDQQGKMRKMLRLSSKTQDERVRLANQAAAQDFLEIMSARQAAASKPTNGQSGPAGPNQQTKLGGRQQQQSQPSSLGSRPSWLGPR